MLQARPLKRNQEDERRDGDCGPGAEQGPECLLTGEEHRVRGLAGRLTEGDREPADRESGRDREQERSGVDGTLEQPSELHDRERDHCDCDREQDRPAEVSPARAAEVSERERAELPGARTEPRPAAEADEHE